MTRDELRRLIDRVDAEILTLLDKRMELVVRTRKLKVQIEDKAREAEVIDRVAARARGLLFPEFAERLYRDIIAESKKQQARELVLAGFQGEHGAYSEMAVRAFMPDATPIAHEDFDDVFDGVEAGILDLGVVPVENSLAGPITQVADRLVDTPLHVVGEVKVPVHHCLLAARGTAASEVRIVYSHPQALSQCRRFLARLAAETRPYYDTAGSAMMLARERPAAAAVIASRLCAELYQLEVVEEHIEDDPSNTTRFLVLSATPGASPSGAKCSVVFATADRPGALSRVLGAFAEAGVNLTRIESRPYRAEPGRAAFFLDFQGDASDPAVEAAIERARLDTSFFRLLGCYPEWRS